MLKRWIAEKLIYTIARTPSVALLGARQVGKTTLARHIFKSEAFIYLDLEAPHDLIKLSDPITFLTQHNNKLIILDEIQRAPELFNILRGVIDNNILTGRKSSQFLFLGSASMELLRQSSESLAGRISYLEMSGLNVLEIPNTTEVLKQLWFRGGFPDSYLAHDELSALNWLENIIRTYLERDIPQMGFSIPASRLRRLWTMLAHLQGETINYSKLATNLEIDSKTVSHYIDVLNDLLLLRKLEPWYENVKKRLVKSPRIYIRDSGILHRLLGISNFDALLSNPILGKSWEGFVLENILAILPMTTKSYFYRTAAGAEIDLLLKISSELLWAIEIKNGSVPKIKKGFHQACEDVHATHKFVICHAKDEFNIAHNTTVTSLNLFLNKLQKLSF